ncbi:unnamed protein product [Ilex paraguariensis]|uniref:Uncharacterized protein n=1 Tax=Ilex paraguariensis TaxID=185542 RepID=A0ABC8T339_9AQUA
MVCSKTVSEARAEKLMAILGVPREWKQVHMADFVKMTLGFIEELEVADSKTRVETYESFFQNSGDNAPMA